MLFEPYIVIYQNVQGHSAVAWPPLCTKSKCFISSQNFFTLWPGKLHMISDRDILQYMVSIDKIGYICIRNSKMTHFWLKMRPTKSTVIKRHDLRGVVLFFLVHF